MKPIHRIKELLTVKQCTMYVCMYVRNCTVVDIFLNVVLLNDMMKSVLIG